MEIPFVSLPLQCRMTRVICGCYLKRITTQVDAKLLPDTFYERSVSDQQIPCGARKLMPAPTVQHRRLRTPESRWPGASQSQPKKRIAGVSCRALPQLEVLYTAISSGRHKDTLKRFKDKYLQLVRRLCVAYHTERGTLLMTKEMVFGCRWRSSLSVGPAGTGGGVLSAERCRSPSLPTTQEAIRMETVEMHGRHSRRASGPPN